MTTYVEDQNYSKEFSRRKKLCHFLSYNVTFRIVYSSTVRSGILKTMKHVRIDRAKTYNFCFCIDVTRRSKNQNELLLLNYVAIHSK